MGGGDRRLRLWGFGFVVLVAGALAGCGGGGSAQTARSEAEAERVAVRWLEEMDRAEIGAACRLMDAGNHRAYPEHTAWSRAEDCRQRWLHSDGRPINWKPKEGRGNIVVWGQEDPEVLAVKLEGDEAVVEVNGIGTIRPVWLIREDGRWRVDHDEYPV